MKKSRIIAPALGVLILSTAASITGTVAWFTANNSVTVTGMQFKTQVGSNLLIATGESGTGTVGESYFGSASSQSLTGLLEPVSTVDGVSFWYTTNAKANGAKESGDYIEYSEGTALTAADTGANKTNYDAAFNTAYGISTANPNSYSAYQTAFGYIDYVYELKAVNTTNAAQYVILSNLDLVYTGSAVDAQKAVRVAMLVQNGTVNNGVVTSYAAFPASAQCIIAVNGATNQTTDSAVSGASAVTSYSSIKATNALTALSVAAGSTQYYKVTMRLWIEGEDTTCTSSTFMSLTDAWRLNAKLDLANANTNSTYVISKFAAKTLKLQTVDTLLYYDGTDLFRAVDRVKLNNGTKLPASLLTSAELDLLNAAFESSYTLNE